MKFKMLLVISILAITSCLFATRSYSKIFPVIEENDLLRIYVGYNEYPEFYGDRDANLDKLDISFNGTYAYISDVANCYSIPGYYYSQESLRSYGTRSFVKDLNDNLLLLLKRYYDEPVTYYDFIYRATSDNITEFNTNLIFFPEEFVTSPRNYIHNIIKDCEDIIYVSYEHEYGGPANDQFIYQTGDNGKTWSQLLNLNHQALTNMLLKDVHPENNNIMFFAKDDGKLYRSEDRGLTTSLVDSTSGMDWYEYIALNGNNDFIFCGNGLIYANCFSVTSSRWKIMKSTDNGFNWIPLSSYNGIGLNCLDIDAQNPGTLYACDNYQIKKSVDYGATFTTLVNGYNVTSLIKGLYQIDGTDTIIFLTIDGLYVYYSENQIYPLNYNVPNVDNDVTYLAASITALAYPNPFNPETTITYSLPENGQTSIQIFNLKGQLVKTLLSDYASSGDHKIIWNGENNEGKKCTSALYFYRIKQNNHSLTRKLVLAK